MGPLGVGVRGRGRAWEGGSEQILRRSWDFFLGEVLGGLMDVFASFVSLTVGGSVLGSFGFHIARFILG